MNDFLTIAIPKGRILEESVELFRKIGIDCDELLSKSRKLIFENVGQGMRYMIVRATDVPTYVEYGCADLGIVGKDTLMEQEKDIYEPLDLKFGYCRMMVAEPAGLAAGDDPSRWRATLPPRGSRWRSSSCTAPSSLPRWWGFPSGSSIWFPPAKP